VAQFLSPEWLAEVQEAANRSERLRRTAASVDLTVRQVVRGGPRGDVTYTVRLSGGSVGVEPEGEASDLDVTQDYDTAVAITRGALSPAAAFADGRLKLGGRVGLLVSYGDAFAGLDDAFASVRESTAY